MPVAEVLQARGKSKFEAAYHQEDKRRHEEGTVLKTVHGTTRSPWFVDRVEYVRPATDKNCESDLHVLRIHARQVLPVLIVARTATPTVGGGLGCASLPEAASRLRSTQSAPRGTVCERALPLPTTTPWGHTLHTRTRTSPDSTPRLHRQGRRIACPDDETAGTAHPVETRRRTRCRTAARILHT